MMSIAYCSTYASIQGKGRSYYFFSSAFFRYSANFFSQSGRGLIWTSFGHEIGGMRSGSSTGKMLYIFGSITRATLRIYRAPDNRMSLRSYILRTIEFASRCANELSICETFSQRSIRKRAATIQLRALVTYPKK